MSPSKPSPRGKKKELVTRKAPGAPKRFKSSYILFFMHVQEEIKKKLPPGTHTAPVVSKKASELWRNLPDKERLHWDNEAAKEKKRYIAEKESYTGPWQVPHTRAKKDPTAPRRNPSAFLLYSVKKRKEIKKKNPHLKTTEISQMLGRLWRENSEEEKRPFVEREEIEREEYKQKMDAWKRDKETKDLKEEEKKKKQDDEVTVDIHARESESKLKSNQQAVKREAFEESSTRPHTNRRKPPPDEYHHSVPVSAPNNHPQAHHSSMPHQSSADFWWSWNEAGGEQHEAENNHHRHQYKDQVYHPALQEGYFRPVEARSTASHNQRYSPIPLHRTDLQDAFFCPSPIVRSNDGYQPPEAVPSWPTQQPQVLQPRYYSHNELSRLSEDNTPSSGIHELFDKPNEMFKNDADLYCSPMSSYDELDPHLSDPQIDPVPIR